MRTELERTDTRASYRQRTCCIEIPVVKPAVLSFVSRYFSNVITPVREEHGRVSSPRCGVAVAEHVSELSFLAADPQRAGAI